MTSGMGNGQSGKFCTQCGASNTAVARFCTTCGASIPAVTASPSGGRRRLWSIAVMLLTVVGAIAAFLLVPQLRALVVPGITGADAWDDGGVAVAAADGAVITITRVIEPTDAPGILDLPLAAADNTPTATPAPTDTPAATDTPMPTDTPVPTDTPAPTDTPVPTDTPIPTATPVPTDTPVPTNTPVPVPPTPTPCSGTVHAPFRSAYDAADGRLGCPTGGAVGGIFMAMEDFEGGRMVWRSDNDRIYVLYGGGGWAVYDDIWFEGDPEYSCEGPPSPPTPQRGFGKIWCTYPAVRQGMGNAVNGEWGADGAIQNFTNGVIIQAGDGRIYALAFGGGWYR